jgi:hypothetical protein
LRITSFSLWDFLHLVCFGIVVGASLSAARVHNSSLAGYSEAAIIGFLLGIMCMWGSWNGGRLVAKRIRQLPGSMHERYFGLMYCGEMVWMLIAGFLGFWVPSVLFALVS